MISLKKFLNEHWINFSLIFSYAILVSVGSYFHELWSDEVRAWMITRDTPMSEFFNVILCERNLWLWYFIMKPFTLIFHDPITLKFISTPIAIASFALIAIYSPFSNLIKILLGVNYFLLFEYAMLSRVYALATVCLVLVCIFHKRRHENPIRYLLAVALLSSSHFWALIIGSTLAVLFLLERLVIKNNFKLRKVELITFIGVLFLSAFNFWSMLAPGNCATQLTFYSQLDFDRIEYAVTRFAKWFYYLSGNEWHKSILDSMPLLSSAFALLFLWNISVTAYAFRRAKVTMMYLILTFLAFQVYLYLNTSPYGAFARHIGNFFLVYFSAHWMFLDGKFKLSRQAKLHFVFALLILAFSGIKIFLLDVQKPFSNGKDVTAVLLDPKFSEYELVPDGEGGFSSSYLGFSNRKFFNSKVKLFIDTVPLHVEYFLNEEGRRLTLAEFNLNWSVANYIMTLRRKEGVEKFIVVRGLPLSDQDFKKSGLYFYKSFTDAIYVRERYWIYLSEDPKNLN